MSDSHDQDLASRHFSRANQARAEAEERGHRLQHVLDTYFMYTDEAQVSLAKTAIIYGCTSLIDSPSLSAAEAYFFANVDTAYLETEDCRRMLSETEQQALSVSAEAIVQEFLPAIRNIDTPNNLDDDNKRDPIAIAYNLLFMLFQSDLLERASIPFRRDVVSFAVSLAVTIQAHQEGAKDAFAKVVELVHALVSHVQAAAN